MMDDDTAIYLSCMSWIKRNAMARYTAPVDVNLLGVRSGKVFQQHIGGKFIQKEV